jgi:hypothetical protein
MHEALVLTPTSVDPSVILEGENYDLKVRITRGITGP